jgi:hypothetical protein
MILFSKHNISLFAEVIIFRVELVLARKHVLADSIF